MHLRSRLWRRCMQIMTLLIATGAHAQTLQGTDLVHALQHGGYVVVMRHASSPAQPPAKELADVENTRDERQLDDRGRIAATAMGEALRALGIPVGDVLTSPAYRALETVRFARLGAPRTDPGLGDNGKSMQGGTEAQAHALQRLVTQFPPKANTFIITHNPNIVAAFPALGAGLADGEALVFGPDGKGGAMVVARVRIEDWPLLQSDKR